MTLWQTHTTISVPTKGKGFTDITAPVNQWLREVGAREGVLVVFIRHTSASLLIQENADPDVRIDLLEALSALAPETRRWRHTIEGPDDMPAHVKSALTATSLSIPVLAEELALGTWQALYVAEHRVKPHTREIVLSFTGSR